MELDQERKEVEKKKNAEERTKISRKVSWTVVVFFFFKRNGSRSRHRQNVTEIHKHKWQCNMLRLEIRVKLKLFPLFCSDNPLNDLFMVSMILAVPPQNDGWSPFQPRSFRIAKPEANGQGNYFIIACSPCDVFITVVWNLQASVVQKLDSAIQRISGAKTNRALKWWHHNNEISEIMRFVRIFWKNNVQEALGHCSFRISWQIP